MRWLIGERADLDMDGEDERGWTALPLVGNGHEAVVQQLLERWADLRELRLDGATAAARYGMPD